MKNLVNLFLSCTLLCGNSVFAQDYEANLRLDLENLMQNSSCTSLWFALDHPKKPTIEIFLGNAKKDDKVIVGSLSKSITGIGIALLIQDGKISKNTKLKEVLPAYLESKGKVLDTSMHDITIGQLLSHRAGLRGNSTDSTPRAVNNRSALSSMSESSTPLDYIIKADGEKSIGAGQIQYSNVGYSFLAVVIEAVSNQSYPEFIRDRVFSPLKIRTAEIGRNWNSVASFIGWKMHPTDMLKIWSALDISRPSLLSNASLKELYLKEDDNLWKDNKTIYAFGSYLRKSNKNESYYLAHDGIADYKKYLRTYDEVYTSQIEANFPGYSWIIVGSEVSKRCLQVPKSQIRSIVNNYLNSL